MTPDCISDRKNRRRKSLFPDVASWKSGAAAGGGLF